MISHLAHGCISHNTKVSDNDNTNSYVKSRKENGNNREISYLNHDNFVPSYSFMV